LLEQLGELFDLVVPRQIQGKTIGEQAERRRRRERFQELGHELARELVRAARRLSEADRSPGSTTDGEAMIERITTDEEYFAARDRIHELRSHRAGGA
jgi:hypothetical protein